MKYLKRLFSPIKLQKPYLVVCAFNNDFSYTKRNYYKNTTEKNNLGIGFAVGTSVVAYLTYKLFYSGSSTAFLKTKTENNPGNLRSDLPHFTRKQVKEHSDRNRGIWVIYKNGVYDITEFVDAHPGGDQILLASGDSIEPFWKIYGQHHTEFVYEMLESFRIGNLVDDQKPLIESSNLTDPFANEPERNTALTATSEKPFNAEVSPPLLGASFYTPNEIFYVRNHLPVPEVDPEKYELEVVVEGNKKTLKLSLDSLKKLPKHTITATIMCAGNRRSEMMQVKPVKGLNWGIGAIGNAQWTGVYLREVLKSMGIDENADFLHVQFEGLDTDPTKKPYGASIPFWKAVDKRGDVLLAYKMNNEPIPRDHGYPVRVIIPGVIGARNVKWLKKIIVSKEECDSHWQQNDYKSFSPSTDWDTVDFSKAPAIQESPVTSAICVPSPNKTIEIKDGHISAHGYAWSGGGRKIIRVDVTIDKGKTWQVAEIVKQEGDESPRHWGWTLWNIKIPVPEKAQEVEIWVKAVDSSYNTQPESFENIWNLRGVLSNAYHKVPVKLKWV